MGGNLVTKMAGELADAAPEALRGVCTVCPSIDLSASADALERRENFFYQRHFVTSLMAHYAKKAALFPGRFSQNGFGSVRTVRQFDDKITAPYFGYRDAQEYYEAVGAKKVIAQVRVPMLMITAQDDPFVPYESLARTKPQQNPAIQFVAPQHGGHCGFISNQKGAERFWAEQRIVEFCKTLSRS
jgi:predicted alpha/beta-fold hydrolase